MSLLKRLFSNKISAVEQKTENECRCGGSYQEIGCPAYDDRTCIWHPDNDPYGLKDREWVDGQFVKKKKS